MDQWDFEKLRDIQEIFQPDFRNLLSISDPKEALIRHHGLISYITLTEDVDDDVKVQFEVARNIFLYSFFYYRFGMTSFKQAAAAAELGLRRYLGKNNQREDTLKKLLRRADSQGYINLKEIKPHLEPKVFIEILTDFRNDLAHGSHSLFPPKNAVDFIKSYAEILNRLFAYKKKHNLKPSNEGWS